MNIEKIKNYNHKMLAVLSTILVAMALIGLISLIVVLVDELTPYNPPSDVLIAGDNVDKLKKDSLRQQIVSYDSPRLVDSANLIYIVPVKIRTLDDPESVQNDVFSDGLFKSGYAKEERSLSYGYYSGTFNNLVVYDYKSGNAEKMCDDRIMGSNIIYKYFDDDILIAFEASTEDTDNDNRITTYDFTSLYLYSLKKRELKKISLPNTSVKSYEFVENRKDLLVTFNYDRDKNNTFESDSEPTIVVKYSYESNKILPLIDKELEQEIQRIIDEL